MALTRNFLKSMGLDEEKINAIIEGHTDTVTAMTRERDEAREKAAKVDELISERDDYKAKYEKAGDATKVQADFDAYKKQVEGEKAKAAKSAAVRAALKAAGVNRDEFAELLMGKVDLDKVEMDGDKVKDTAALVDPLKASYAGCFGTVEEKGTDKTSPPSGGGKSYTAAEIRSMPLEKINENWDAIRASLPTMK
nr:hypothetical protein [Clostridia bacterium]